MAKKKTASKKTARKTSKKASRSTTKKSARKMARKTAGKVRSPRIRTAPRREISLDQLAQNPVYPKTRLMDLDELTDAIRETRFIIPPEVVQVGRSYVLLDGHRRVAVARLLGLGSLACNVLPTQDDPRTAFIRWQSRMAEADKRRAWLDRQRAAVGLPPLTDAEAESAETSWQQSEQEQELLADEAAYNEVDE